MFKYLSTKHLAMMAISLDDETNENITKRKIRVWVHDILKRRKMYPEFYTLYTLLEDHEEK